jgi:DNA-binding MarR family transcriptional regulator
VTIDTRPDGDLQAMSPATSDPAVDRSLELVFGEYERLDAGWRNQFDLSANEKLVLTFLWIYGDMPLGRLASRVGVTSGGLTSLVDRLEAKGLVTRLSDPNDRRRSLASLTAQGHESRGPFHSLVQEAADHVAGLDERDGSVVSEFIRWLATTMAERGEQAPRAPVGRASS